MKFISSELLQASKKNRIGKYRLTIELTDTDIEFFENLGGLPMWSVCDADQKDVESANKKLRSYFKNIFHKLWRDHDDC